MTLVRAVLVAAALLLLFRRPDGLVDQGVPREQAETVAQLLAAILLCTVFILSAISEAADKIAGKS